MKRTQLNQNDIDWILSNEDDFENSTFRFDDFESIDEYFEKSSDKSLLGGLWGNVENAKESGIQYLNSVVSVFEHLF